MTKISARKVGSTDLRWSKFVGTGKERNAFLSSFFPVPVFSRSFPRTSLVLAKRLIGTLSAIPHLILIYQLNDQPK